MGVDGEAAHPAGISPILAPEPAAKNCDPLRRRPLDLYDDASQ